MLKRYSQLASRIRLNVYLQFQPDIEQLSQLTVSGDIHVEMAFINVHFIVSVIPRSSGLN